MEIQMKNSIIAQFMGEDFAKAFLPTLSQPFSGTSLFDEIDRVLTQAQDEFRGLTRIHQFPANFSLKTSAENGKYLVSVKTANNPALEMLVTHVDNAQPEIAIREGESAAWKKITLQGLAEKAADKASKLAPHYSTLLKQLYNVPGLSALAKSLGVAQRQPDENKPGKPVSDSGDNTSATADNKNATPVAQAPAPASVRIARSNQPDLVFEGKALAQVATQWVHGRRQVYALFKTTAGKIVAVKSGQSLWVGEEPKNEVQVADSVSEMVPFFGFTRLAKALYGRLDENHRQEIVGKLEEKLD